MKRGIFGSQTVANRLDRRIFGVQAQVPSARRESKDLVINGTVFTWVCQPKLQFRGGTEFSWGLGRPPDQKDQNFIGLPPAKSSSPGMRDGHQSRACATTRGLTFTLLLRFCALRCGRWWVESDRHREGGTTRAAQQRSLPFLGKRRYFLPRLPLHTHPDE